MAKGSIMSPWLKLRLCLTLSCVALLADITAAQDLQQSVAITLASGQSTVESLQVTVPVVLQTTTQVSQVTVTQISIETSTVMSMVTQMQTVTVPETCAATTQAVASPSSLAVVTAGALNQVDSTPSVTSGTPDSSATAGMSASTAVPAVAAASSVALEPCDCSCLCPMAAFPMAANVSQVAGPLSGQMSTFQTMASVSAAKKAAVSSSTGLPATSSAAATLSRPNPIITGSAAVAASIAGVLPSVIVTDPGAPTGKVQVQNTQDVPFNINTYQLMKSVGLPVVVGGTADPSAGL